MPLLFPDSKHNVFQAETICLPSRNYMRSVLNEIVVKKDEKSILG